MRRRHRGDLVTVFGLVVLAAVGCSRIVPEVPGVADPTSERRLAQGTIVGFTGRYDAHVWQGIPYAEPPIGALRWRAPQAPVAWTGSRSALTVAPVCTQLPSVFGGVESSNPDRPVGQEDCLYLNVFAPRFTPDTVPHAGGRLPVMVWIHGGGNVVGHAGRYDGGHLAVGEQVIIVTLNYRLGPFGWFRHAALRASAHDDDDRSGNYGTLDMVRGLAWVHDNIAAFGGDPENVTIFGESAGGRDVFSLLLSPRARGLVQRAIVQSGGTATTTLDDAESFTDATPPGRRNSSNEIVLRVLAGPKGEARAAARQRVAALAPAEVASRLRALPAAELLRAYKLESQEGLIDVPQLFRDGFVLPAGDPIEALRAGDYNRVPTIFGTNKDENKLFMALSPEFTWRLLGLVPVVRDPATYDATARLLSLHWKARGADQPAGTMRAVQGPSVWVYRFDWDEEPSVLTVDVGKLLGAAHGLEIPFVFGHWDLGSQTKLLFSAADEPGRVGLSQTMMRYWAAFARGGDPNGGAALPRWEPFAVPEGRFLVLDTERSGGVRMESGVVTAADAIAGVERDPAFTSPQAKCAVYRSFVEWAHEPSPEAYPQLVGGACATYPLTAGR